MNSRFAIIDFETTGLSPDYGDRITEVAVVIVESNQVVDQYQSLVNTGVSVPYHIQKLTGITDQMISNAPPADKVIPELNQFIKHSTLVAHNASFDSKFFHSEMSKAGIKSREEFICTLLLSRRLYPFVENLKLVTLAHHHGIKYQGRSHRALADALVTADLFIQINSDLKRHLSVSSISPKKFLSCQRETISNFSKFAKLLKTQKKTANPVITPVSYCDKVTQPYDANSFPTQTPCLSKGSPTKAGPLKSTWLKTQRGLQNKITGLLIPYADTLRDVFPVAGYTIKGNDIGFIKDSEIE